MIEIKTNILLRLFENGAWHDSGGKIVLTLEADTLAGMDLSQRQLGHVDLHGHNLRRVSFRRTFLNGTAFSDADLSDADYKDATLWFISLKGACLAGSDFSGALLQGARLQGVDLRLANIATAELRFARYDAQTQWPEEINPQERGATLT